jgi:alkanesulfonate monooxygenase SsuD/methylene tetrahydromethanopterin reductase-like flavin-dependent oxidoreductase (luciferase family)
VNVLAADTDDDAQALFRRVRRARVGIILGRDRTYTDEEADAILASPNGRAVEQMLHHSAVGTPDAVERQLADFAQFADADELMVVHAAPSVEARLRSVELVAGG